VTIDFSQFQASQHSNVTHPRELFSALGSRAPGFGYLRDVQGQVLDKWFDRRSDRDISIKMNTGTGKTLVGLLALQSSINELEQPALYVAPDNFLVSQVIEQAESLGLETTDDPDTAAYRSGRAIGVVNIHKLVNGRSVFGAPGSQRAQPLPIGTVAIDDAHACLSTISAQTTLQIVREHDAFRFLLELFSESLKNQALGTFSDIENGVAGDLLRVPIVEWNRQIDAVLEHLQSMSEDPSIGFVLPFLRDILPICQAIFSGQRFELHPLCPPTNSILSLEGCTRRIYLTATLADDSVLVTHFGASRRAAETPITPLTAADIGDRLILSPREIDPKLTDHGIRLMVSELAESYNVVVVVPSYRAAKPWEDFTNHIIGADQLTQITARLKSETVGLVVLVNKYDGIDLPDDACRVLVLDGMPEPANLMERREAHILGGSPLLNQRRLQKIEQGMGRGVRSAEDYCVVVLMGSDLSATLSMPAMLQRLSPATRAQLELSAQISQRLTGVDLVALMKQCLGRDQKWTDLSRGRLAGVAYDPGYVSDFAEACRAAFVAAGSGQYAEAKSLLQDISNRTEDNTLRGWLMEQLATYVEPLDPAESQQILAAAVRRNRRVLRPLSGVTYKRASATIDQARSARNAVVQKYSNGTELRLGLDALASRLVFDTERSLDFEDAIEELGEILGFISQRPERDTGRGPDALWGMGELSFLVIECKSASTGDVWKKDAGQLATSINWFQDEYDSTCSATPIMFHHSGKHAEDAVTDSKTRIVDESCLAKLREDLRALGVALTHESTFSSDSLVAEQLNQFGFNRSAFIERFTTRPPRR